jgi:hypothetical protein
LPEQLASALWLSRWSDAIAAGGARLATELGPELSLGTITAVCALDYVPFRLSDLGIDIGSLTQWRSTFAERPSFARTLPDSPLT